VRRAVGMGAALVDDVYLAHQRLLWLL
jgi:hypothetical protein